MGEVFDFVVGAMWGSCVNCLPLLYGAVLYLLAKEAWK